MPVSPAPKLTEEQILLGEHHLKELGVEQVLYEHYFCDNRDWRLDIYLPEHRIGIEIHGGQFTGGHRRGFWSKKEGARRRKLGLKETPQEDEYDKLNHAQMDWIRTLQFTNEQVRDGRAKEFLACII